MWKITKDACARLKVHSGFDYGSFLARLVLFRVRSVGVVSGVSFGLAWGLFGFGLRLVESLFRVGFRFLKVCLVFMM